MRPLQPDELRPDVWAVWMHVPRGGYGYVLPVVCQIVRTWERSGRVTIAVRTKHGELVERRVKADSLRLPENWKPPTAQA